MKKGLFLLLFSCLFFTPIINGQQLFVPGGTLGTSSNGNVGVGTDNPQFKFSLNGYHADTRLHLHSLGGGDDARQADLLLWASEPGWTYTGVGIGNNVFNNNGINRINSARAASYIRLLENEISFSFINLNGDAYNRFAISSDGNLRSSGLIYSTQDGYDQTYLRSWGLSGNGTIFIEPSASNDLYLTDSWSATGTLGIHFGKTVFQTGNVLIGKDSQSNIAYKLDVAGKVRVDEIVVNTTGADFVFEKNYKLRPLSEVETFIKQNKHLPDVAPAKEMQTNGVSMGDMQAKLLQKVEELTLYVIELKKENEQIKQENKKIKNEMQTLKSSK